ALNFVEVVANEQNGSPALSKASHLSQALLLKCRIAYCEHFVDDQNLGFEVRGNRKCKPDIHPRRVTLHGGVEEILNLGERHDFIEFPYDFGAGHAEDGPIQENILSPCQFLMKSCPDFEKACNSSLNANSPFCGLGDSAQDPQECALSGAIASDNPNNVASFDVERHVPQRPELGFPATLASPLLYPGDWRAKCALDRMAHAVVF